MDKFSSSSAINVYGTDALKKTVAEAGGKVNNNKPSFSDNGEIYDFGPDGDDFADWYLEKKYKDDLEYQNFMSIPSIIAEHYNIPEEEAKKIFEGTIDESWEENVKQRVHYTDNKDLKQVKAINTKQFTKVIENLIEDWSIRSGKDTITIDDEDVFVGKPVNTTLILGAPGIGKSTIPQTVIDTFNEKVAKFDPSKMITLIKINCANLSAGDFMMPTMPKENDILGAITKFEKSFPQSSKYLEKLDKDKKEEVAAIIRNSGQFKATDAPKAWLPSYRKVGDDELNKMLDDYSNGGVYEDKDHKSYTTGGGGIILFDEFFRGDKDIFNQLLNFLLDRELNGWKLGSKWAIIACSNRPCDDSEVEGVFKSWKGMPAAKDRWTQRFQLIPDPESWKAWAKKKHCDDMILAFIFDKTSKVGDEWPRWHTAVRNGSNDADQFSPVTPRRWEEAFCAITKLKIQKSRETGKKIGDLAELDLGDIKETLEAIFDVDFVAEFTQWIKDHKDKIDLVGIMKDPTSVYLPKKFINDPRKAVNLINNLYNDFENTYKDHYADVTEEELANIFIWLGINYKDDIYAVHDFMEKIESLYPYNSKCPLDKYSKVYLVQFAAFPEKDTEDDIENLMQTEYTGADGIKYTNKYPLPKNSLKIVKDMMKKYFPWRISGDEIVPYGNVDTSAYKEEKEKMEEEKKQMEEETSKKSK